MEHRSERFTALKNWYAGYTVYDQDDDKIGTIDVLFVDENDQMEPACVRVRM